MKKIISTQHSKLHRICQNCFFSIYAFGRPRPVLMCKQRTNYPGLWQLCQPIDTCSSFYPSSASSDSTRLIPLTKGLTAIIDADNFLDLSADRWAAACGKTTSYAVCRRKGRLIQMHRVIMGAPEHLMVDHINHNGLDNRKDNLRLATPTQNCANQRPRTNCFSKYKGVQYHKRDKIFHATVSHNKKRIHLGGFKNEIMAALAYDAKAKELHGEFACLNFPDV